jgi:hypothetical protein
MKSKEYNIGEAVPKSNRKIVVPEVKLTLLHFSNMSLINGKVALSIYVFSDPWITDIVWMREVSGKTTDNRSPKNAMKLFRQCYMMLL